MSWERLNKIKHFLLSCECILTFSREGLRGSHVVSPEGCMYTFLTPKHAIFCQLSPSYMSCMHPHWHYFNILLGLPVAGFSVISLMETPTNSRVAAFREHEHTHRHVLAVATVHGVTVSGRDKHTQVESRVVNADPSLLCNWLSILASAWTRSNVTETFKVCVCVCEGRSWEQIHTCSHY